MYNVMFVQYSTVHYNVSSKWIFNRKKNLDTNFELIPEIILYPSKNVWKYGGEFFKLKEYKYLFYSQTIFFSEKNLQKLL